MTMETLKQEEEEAEVYEQTRARILSEFKDITMSAVDLLKGVETDLDLKTTSAKELLSILLSDISNLEITSQITQENLDLFSARLHRIKSDLFTFKSQEAEMINKELESTNSVKSEELGLLRQELHRLKTENEQTKENERHRLKKELHEMSAAFEVLVAEIQNLEDSTVNHAELDKNKFQELRAYSTKVKTELEFVRDIGPENNLQIEVVKSLLSNLSEEVSRTKLASVSSVKNREHHELVIAKIELQSLKDQIKERTEGELRLVISACNALESEVQGVIHERTDLILNTTIELRRRVSSSLSRSTPATQDDVETANITLHGLQSELQRIRADLLRMDSNAKAKLELKALSEDLLAFQKHTNSADENVTPLDLELNSLSANILNLLQSSAVTTEEISTFKMRYENLKTGLDEQKASELIMLNNRKETEWKNQEDERRKIAEKMEMFITENKRERETQDLKMMEEIKRVVEKVDMLKEELADDDTQEGRALRNRIGILNGEAVGIQSLEEREIPAVFSLRQSYEDVRLAVLLHKQSIASLSVAFNQKPDITDPNAKKDIMDELESTKLKNSLHAAEIERLKLLLESLQAQQPLVPDPLVLAQNEKRRLAVEVEQMEHLAKQQLIMMENEPEEGKEEIIPLYEKVIREIEEMKKNDIYEQHGVRSLSDKMAACSLQLRKYLEDNAELLRAQKEVMLAKVSKAVEHANRFGADSSSSMLPEVTHIKTALLGLDLDQPTLSSLVSSRQALSWLETRLGAMWPVASSAHPPSSSPLYSSHMEEQQVLRTLISPSAEDRGNMATHELDSVQELLTGREEFTLLQMSPVEGGRGPKFDVDREGKRIAVSEKEGLAIYAIDQSDKTARLHLQGGRPCLLAGVRPREIKWAPAGLYVVEEGSNDLLLVNDDTTWVQTTVAEGLADEEHEQGETSVSSRFTGDEDKILWLRGGTCLSSFNLVDQSIKNMKTFWQTQAVEEGDLEIPLRPLLAVADPSFSKFFGVGVDSTKKEGFPKQAFMCYYEESTGDIMHVPEKDFHAQIDRWDSLEISRDALVLFVAGQRLLRGVLGALSFDSYLNVLRFVQVGDQVPVQARALRRVPSETQDCLLVGGHLAVHVYTYASKSFSLLRSLSLPEGGSSPALIVVRARSIICIDTLGNLFRRLTGSVLI